MSRKRKRGKGAVPMRETNSARRRLQASAARSAAAAGNVVRGTVCHVRCDINVGSERGARPDGSDQHRTKSRPVIVWNILELDGGVVWEVVPMTSCDSEFQIQDPVQSYIGRPFRGSVILRLVTVDPGAVRGATMNGQLTDRDIAALGHAIESGEVVVLTATTGRSASRRKWVAGREVWHAQDAFEELRRRRAVYLEQGERTLQARRASNVTSLVA